MRYIIFFILLANISLGQTTFHGRTYTGVSHFNSSHSGSDTSRQLYTDSLKIVDRLGIGVTSTSAIVHVSKSISANAWTTNGIGFRIAAATYTDLTSTGSPSAVYINSAGAPTYAATNIITPTNVYAWNWEAPADGSNVTSTNRYVFRIAGTSEHVGSIRFTGGSRSIGSFDNNDFMIRTNNTIRATFTSTGRLGIGTTAPTPTSDFTLSGSMGLAYSAKTATYSIGSSDYLIDCTANTFTVTLPTAVSITGRIYVIKNSGSGVITVATTSSQTIDGNTTATLNQYDSITIMSNGSNWIII